MLRMKKVIVRWGLVGGLTACVSGRDDAVAEPAAAALASNSDAAARDWRHRIAASEFTQTTDGAWLSPEVRPQVPFDELIYSWHLNRPGDTFRLYLRVGFAPGDETGWLYAGFWGAVDDLVAKRQQPVFDRGVLDMDWLRLKAPAVRFQFKAVPAGGRILSGPPALTVIATDNHPPQGRVDHEASLPPSRAVGLPGRVLDIPLRRQFDSQGRRLVDRCQSAALASAMEYFGQSVPLEEIVRHTFDPEYDYPGIWPRVTGAAQEFGFDAYIERFRDWNAVRRALAENKVLLCSMRMQTGECESPPYRSMGNHIVALCGVTDDGRVVVTDSFLGKSGAGYLCQWLQADFEKVWMRTKGGIAMVICPPEGGVTRTVSALPPFPAHRGFPAGDDH